MNEGIRVRVALNMLMVSGFLVSAIMVLAVFKNLILYIKKCRDKRKSKKVQPIMLVRRPKSFKIAPEKSPSRKKILPLKRLSEVTSTGFSSKNLTMECGSKTMKPMKEDLEASRNYFFENEAQLESIDFSSDQ